MSMIACLLLLPPFLFLQTLFLYVTHNTESHVFTLLPAECPLLPPPFHPFILLHNWFPPLSCLFLLLFPSLFSRNLHTAWRFLLLCCPLVSFFFNFVHIIFPGRKGRGVFVSCLSVACFWGVFFSSGKGREWKAGVQRKELRCIICISWDIPHTFTGKLLYGSYSFVVPLSRG